MWVKAHLAARRELGVEPLCGDPDHDCLEHRDTRMQSNKTTEPASAGEPPELELSDADILDAIGMPTETDFLHRLQADMLIALLLRKDVLAALHLEDLL